MKYVLDSSALLAVAFAEKGAAQVEAVAALSVISSVNLAECVSRAVMMGINADQAMAQFLDMMPNVVAFDEKLAFLAGTMIEHTKAYGLSLGDRACLATAVHLQLEAVTADKVWNKLKLPVKIRLIR